MATYAVLEGNQVENLIVADSLEIAEQLTGKSCILHKNNEPVSIGWTYNSVTEKFSAPE